MVFRDVHVVMECLPGHGHHIQYVVLRSVWRNCQAVKMQIRHIHARVDQTLFVQWAREIIDVGDFQLISRCKSQGRSVWLSVKVKRVLSVGRCGSAESERKDMVLRAKFRWIRERI